MQQWTLNHAKWPDSLTRGMLLQMIWILWISQCLPSPWIAAAMTQHMGRQHMDPMLFECSWKRHPVSQGLDSISDACYFLFIGNLESNLHVG